MDVKDPKLKQYVDTCAGSTFQLLYLFSFFSVRMHPPIAFHTLHGKMCCLSADYFATDSVMHLNQFLKECIPNLVLLLLFVSRGRIRKNISKPLRLSARSRLRRIWDLRDLNASSTRCGDQKWSWNKIVSKRPGGFAVFFLLEDMGRVGCWFQRYIVLMFTLRKKEEMMEVCYVGRDDAFFLNIFFHKLGVSTN